MARICLYPAHFLNNRVKQTNWYKNVIPDLDNYPTNKWYREHLERNYDLVVVGSSTGVYDFDFSGIDIKYFNWSLQPQAMEYSLKVLMNFFSIIKKDGLVIIPFSPFSGLRALGKQGKEIDDRYYHLLDRTLIDNLPEVSRRRNYPLYYHPKESLKRLIKDVPPRKQGRNCRVCHASDEFQADACKWIEGWMREFNIQDLNAPLSSENKQSMAARSATLQSIADFCAERDLRLVLVMPPMHPALADKFTPTFRQNYIYNFLKPFKSQGVPYYDYMDSNKFKADNLFDNAYFMSQKGAAVFTKEFIKQLGL